MLPKCIVKSNVLKNTYVKFEIYLHLLFFHLKICYLALKLGIIGKKSARIKEDTLVCSIGNFNICIKEHEMKQ